MARTKINEMSSTCTVKPVRTDLLSFGESLVLYNMSKMY